MSKKTGKKKPLALVKGVLEITRSGIGYLIAEGRDKDVLVRPNDFNKAMDGDTVSVKIKESNGRRIEGAVQDVLARIVLAQRYDFVVVVRAGDRDIPTDLRHVNGLDGQRAFKARVLDLTQVAKHRPDKGAGRRRDVKEHG